jgi:hypothetical protein
MTLERLSLFDTTLCDGQQTQGIQFPVAERVTTVTALLPAEQTTRAKNVSVNILLLAESNPLKSLMSNPVPRWDTP